MNGELWRYCVCFLAGSGVTAVVFAIVHLVRLPLVEVQIAALVRYRAAAAKRKAAAEIAAETGGDAEKLELAGQFVTRDPETGELSRVSQKP